MLCRVADSLFWMSRYIERAENTARLVDVNLQLLLDAEAARDESPGGYWEPLLNSTGELGLFQRHYDTLDSPSVMEFLTFCRDNPSSLFNCVLAARENARMIRDQISAEMWEVINRLYFLVKQSERHQVGHSALYEFFKQVKEHSSLFHGVTETTFPHEVGYEFIKAGRFLERAEKTGRIIDSKLHLFEGETPEALAILHWGAVLRACSASSTYQQTYRTDVRARNVIGLLLTSREFPRAMLYCLSQLQLAIHAISGCPTSHYSNEAERLVGRLISELSYTSIDELVAQGVHSFLLHAQKEIERITVELSGKYMFFPIVDPASEASA